jgi:hypothetical protein
MNVRNRRILLRIVVALCAVLILSVTVAGILTWKKAEDSYGFAREVDEREQALRLQLVQKAESWLNTNELDGSHKKIIDIYNAHEPLAQGYTVTYTDKWCATFGSTVAIQIGFTDIIPTECGCQRQIALFEKLGRWEEDDNYIPLPGDYIFYSSRDLEDEDCGGFSDHVGIVVGTCDGYIKVIEGNYVGTVRYRIIPIGDPSIRGYGLPDYASKTKEKNGAA